MVLEYTKGGAVIMSVMPLCPNKVMPQQEENGAFK